MQIASAIPIGWTRSINVISYFLHYSKFCNFSDLYIFIYLNLLLSILLYVSYKLPNNRLLEHLRLERNKYFCIKTKNIMFSYSVRIIHNKDIIFINMQCLFTSANNSEIVIIYLSEPTFKKYISLMSSFFCVLQ